MADQKNLSGEEKRKKLKEDYKRELIARKQFSEKVNRLKKEQKILKALEDMKAEDDTDEWISKLNEESAFAEARAEIALEAVEEEKREIESREYQVEMEKLAAQKLVEEMKRSLGMLPEEVEIEGEEEGEAKEEEKPEAEAPKKEKPKKPEDNLGDF